MTRAEFIQAFVVQHANMERALRFAKTLEESGEAPWDELEAEEDPYEQLFDAVENLLATPVTHEDDVTVRATFQERLKALEEAWDSLGDDDEEDPE